MKQNTSSFTLTALTKDLTMNQVNAVFFLGLLKDANAVPNSMNGYTWPSGGGSSGGNLSLPGNVSVPINITQPCNMTVPSNLTQPGNIGLRPENTTSPGNFPSPENSTVPGNVTIPSISLPRNCTQPCNHTTPGNYTAPLRPIQVEPPKEDDDSWRKLPSGSIIPSIGRPDDLAEHHLNLKMNDNYTGNYTSPAPHDPHNGQDYYTHPRRFTKRDYYTHTRRVIKRDYYTHTKRVIKRAEQGVPPKEIFVAGATAWMLLFGAIILFCIGPVVVVWAVCRSRAKHCGETHPLLVRRDSDGSDELVEWSRSVA